MPKITICSYQQNMIADCSNGIIRFYVKKLQKVEKKLLQWAFAHECRHVWQAKKLRNYHKTMLHLTDEIRKLGQYYITQIKIEDVEFKILYDDTLDYLVSDIYHDLLPDEVDANIYAFIRTGCDFSRTALALKGKSRDDYMFT